MKTWFTSPIACVVWLSLALSSFTLAQEALAQEALPQDWPGESWSELATNQDVLMLKFKTFDPTDGLPPMPSALAPHSFDAPESGWSYKIVQWKSQPSIDERQFVEEMGAEILEYVPNNAYLIRGSRESLALIESQPTVRASVPFAPAFRIDPEALLAAQGFRRIYIAEFFEGEDRNRVQAAILATGSEILPHDGPANRFRLLAAGDRLDRIAHIQGLYWIQEEPQAQLRNDRTAWVIQSGETDQTPLWNRGLLGEDQVIGHIDDPLDPDNCYFNDPGVPVPGPTHRKIIFHRGNTSRFGDHGTHTAGTAAGDQELISGSTFRNGMAYRSKLAHTNLSSVSGTNLGVRLQELYDQGARVFTNSWGNDSTTRYDAWARDIDVFSWENEDALAMWAVTNGSILRNPENAKNCLAVGATNQTPREDSHCSGGRGPTSDGRRKPEIYAPGCGIRSARSGTSCGVQSFSGTSMACPAITGAAALVRQYFTEGYYPSGAPVIADAFAPSGSLIKAVLVNGSVDMTGISNYPSELEGWGRLVADNALYFGGDSIGNFVQDVRQAQGFNLNGDIRTYNIDVVDASSPLEITLAWHDFPAALFASLTPVNNLDLRVTSPSGTIYFGNSFAGGQSSGSTPDVLNNVERVRRDQPEIGTWVVEILATAIAQPGQGFAVAASGGLSPQAPPGDCLDPVAYGVATTGTGNIDPVIEAVSWPYLGHDNYELMGDSFLGGIQGALLIGFSQDNDSSGGWTRLVDVTPPSLIVPLAFDGTGAGMGSRNISLSIPDNPVVVSVTFYAQFIGLDPGASSGISASPGLTSVICDPNG